MAVNVFATFSSQPSQMAGLQHAAKILRKSLTLSVGDTLTTTQTDRQTTDGIAMTIAERSVVT